MSISVIIDGSEEMTAEFEFKADAAIRALQVLVLDCNIREHLVQTDPMVLKQAENALKDLGLSHQPPWTQDEIDELYMALHPADGPGHLDQDCPCIVDQPSMDINAVSQMSQNYQDKMNEKTQCYQCNFSTKLIPCTNCGHDAPLVKWGATRPMVAHNQPLD